MLVEIVIAEWFRLRMSADVTRSYRAKFVRSVLVEQKEGVGSDVRCEPTAVSSGRGSDGVVTTSTILSASSGETFQMA